MMIDEATNTVYWVGQFNCFAAPIVNGRTDFTQKIPLERWQIKNEEIQEKLRAVSFIKDDTDFDLKYLEKIPMLLHLHTTVLSMNDPPTS